MSGKKQTNFLIGTILLLVSVLFIFFTSGSSSKLISGFKEVAVSPTPEEGVEIDYGEDVNTDTNFSGPPTAVPEDESVEPAEESISQTTYQVVKVVDGDTLDVVIDGKIERLRLIGIDTPETVDPRKSVQCFGIEASNKAKELLTGQFVSLEYDETQGERDKYKRLLRYVFLPNGTNFNQYMIAEGYAHEYTYDEPYKYQPEFKQAEVNARSANKGLWSPTTCSGNK